MLENDYSEFKTYSLKNKKKSISSMNSIPEFKNNYEDYIRKSIIITNVTCFLLGINFLIKKDFYFNKNYQYIQRKSLIIFIIIFSLGVLGTFILSFIISLIIYSISKVKSCIFSKKEENLSNNSNEINVNNNENQLLLNEKVDTVSLLPYTLTITIILTILFYILGFPFSFYLIYTLLKNNFYSSFFNFYLLYLFLLINNIEGAIFIFVLIFILVVKSKENNRKESLNYDEDNMEKYFIEIKDAINLAK